MSGWTGLSLVTRREIRERARTKGFLISSIVTLVVITAAIVIPSIVGGGADTHRVGVLGEGNEPIVAAASEFSVAEVADEGDQEPDTYETVSYGSRDEAAEGLQRRGRVGRPDRWSDRSCCLGRLRWRFATRHVCNKRREPSACRISWRRARERRRLSRSSPRTHSR